MTGTWLDDILLDLDAPVTGERFEVADRLVDVALQWRIALDGAGRKTTHDPRVLDIEQCFEIGWICQGRYRSGARGSAKLQGFSLVSGQEQVLDNK
jgi:hypothetical protein